MFEGFSPETVDFLWGIRLNNNREWFMAHKKDYQKYLYEPMKELGKYLYEPFMDETGVIMKVSRIYRDARMHPPEPYKESLWICIRRDVEWWAENPCQYLEIRPEGVSYGMIFWKPKVAALEQFRKDIAQQPEQFLALIEETERATGVRVEAEDYKRISCSVDVPVGEDMFGPELADRARDFITALTPLTRFLSQYGG